MSARKRARRAAWRIRLRERAQRERAVRAVGPRLAHARALGPLALRAAVAELLEVGGKSAAESPYRRTLAEWRALRRQQSTDALASRREWLAGAREVMTQDRLRVIVRTSDVAIARPSRDGVAWVWDGDSVETYQRVRAMRGAL